MGVYSLSKAVYKQVNDENVDLIIKSVCLIIETVTDVK